MNHTMPLSLKTIAGLFSSQITVRNGRKVLELFSVKLIANQFYREGGLFQT